MDMEKKELKKVAGLYILQTICGICAMFIAIGLYCKHLYEPNEFIRYFEIILCFTSGAILTVYAFFYLMFAWRDYLGTNFQKRN